MNAKQKFNFLFLGFALAAALLPVLTSAQTTLPNPILASPANSNSATIIDIVFAVFAGFAAVFSLFAFGFLIFNGFKLVIAHDNPEMATVAKNGITWAVAGFALAILSFSVIAATSAILGGTGLNELASPNNLQPPVQSCSAGTTGGPYGFVCIFTRVINGILALSALTAAIMIVYSGYRMIFSAGNPQQVLAAKTVLRWAIVGMVVVILSFTIISIVNRAVLGLTP